ncbi:MAG: hypothetical protein A3F33_02030 [Candidatus Woykebacteria bacterium RIFCSPHIGHO2_12_FULL_43_10]|uniref:Uncharacterized protein n=2 Tax=Candidatus Woykeibacteriota TaxID=1817899 RepID=A0A1G1WYS0_9BACT|nr:MAG: hypothetical protein A3F33_02030 [Candidatus Woykebacteria bacterium RIFCSPHIGHO2_12_FULL_43_10]OGY29460.1 MAG: hypothetical protein A3J50_00645 [Candidatus Woykebacteria bacterium RIFCSPHIGHO2_02_FULL_43_16b]OGY32864.1 MAG: hypothetical protein A3A61_03900 [Candidatus Woykebacteria bacterium RIFCSPLOWO2_01_FULL_43_14]
MRLSEHDLFAGLWSLHPVLIFVGNLVLSQARFYLYEWVLSQRDASRLPHGLAAFRYATVTLGDAVFIGHALLVMREYYSRVLVPESFWTSTAFSIGCLVIGFALSLAYLISKDGFPPYPAGYWTDFDRWTHFTYFGIVGAIMVGFLRAPFYGQETGLWVATFVLFLGGYGLTIWMTVTDHNPLWHYIQAHVPGRPSLQDSNVL